MLKSILQRLMRRYVYEQIRRGPSIVQTKFFGFNLLVRAHEEVGRNIIVGDFEADDLRHFHQNVRVNDLVFDAGANIGAYCVTLGGAIPSAKIFAFEPILLNSALIKASLLNNRIENVEVINACVSDQPGEVDFSVSRDSAYSSMIDTGRKLESERVRCEAVSFDSFCATRGLAAPDIIKIDVEGAEYKVLQGARHLLFSSPSAPRLVLIELFDPNLAAFGSSISEIVAFMASAKYIPYVLIDGVKTPFSTEHHNTYYNVFFERK